MIDPTPSKLSDAISSVHIKVALVLNTQLVGENCPNSGQFSEQMYFWYGNDMQMIRKE